jgi:hypothetical protein
MNKYNDHLEKIIAAILGVIGTVAILIKMDIKDFELETVLDGVKDIASLIVVVAVFLLASRLLRKKKQGDFISVFEEHLKDWGDKNKYLIDTSRSEEERGTKDPRRSYFMVVDHSNIVTKNKLASQFARNLKGAFLNLPVKNDMDKPDQRIEFQLNAATFKRQTIYMTSEGEPDLKRISVEFSKRVLEEFGNEFNIDVTPESDRFIISLKNIEKYEDTARKLVNLVEFVKTMVLALA